MNYIFTPKAWQEYNEWREVDKKTQKKINQLIESIDRDGINRGLGQPEPLRYRKEFSRRIDQANRLVYTLDDRGDLLILSCKGHYGDK